MYVQNRVFGRQIVLICNEYGKLTLSTQARHRVNSNERPLSYIIFFETYYTRTYTQQYVIYWGINTKLMCNVNTRLQAYRKPNRKTIHLKCDFKWGWQQWRQAIQTTLNDKVWAYCRSVCMCARAWYCVHYISYAIKTLTFWVLISLVHHHYGSFRHFRFGDYVRVCVWKLVQAIWEHEIRSLWRRKGEWGLSHSP